MPGQRILALTILGASATFTPLGDLPGGPFYSWPSAVSDDGETVVGQSRSSSQSGSYEAFRWTASTGMVGLGDFGRPVPRSTARDVSADGSVIVGDGTQAGSGSRVPFAWTAKAGMTALGDSVDEFTGGQAFGVSADGSVVVGVGVSAFGNQAFRWTPSTGMVGLGWLPSSTHDSFAFDVSTDGSKACGISNSTPPGAVEATRWIAGSGGPLGLGDVPGGIAYAIAWGISGDGGTIVGAARTSFGNDELFVWREETGFVLPDAEHGASFGSSAQAASGDGSLVVGYGRQGALLWDAAHGMRALQSLLEHDHGLDLTGWALSAATDISPDGLAIAGFGTNPAGNAEGWLVRFDPATDVPAGDEAARESNDLDALNPAPVAGVTRFRLTLSAPDRVRAEIFDMRGRRLRAEDHGRLETGVHELEWSGRDGAGFRASPGIYLLRVSTTRWSATRKIVRL